MIHPPKFFHGGAPRLGGFIDPPSKTGAESLHRYGSVGRTDRVYITTDIEAAKLYAALHPSAAGWVYQVEPVGGLHEDPDCTIPGLSFECDRARIVSGKRLKFRHRERILRAATLRGEP